MEATKLIDEIRNYGMYSEKVVLSTLMAIWKPRTNVINLSAPGLGKSWGTAKLCEMLLDKNDYVVITGHQTPMSFFKRLQDNCDKIIIIDESATLIRNEEILNFLFTALHDGYAEWENSKEKLRVELTNSVIFNTNSLRSNAFTDALKDRCVFNEIALTSRQIKESIKSRREPDYNVWKEIKTKIVKNRNIDLTKDNADRVEKIWMSMDLKSKRTPTKIKNIASFLQALFDNIELIDLFVDKDDIQRVLEDESIQDSEKVKRIAEIRKISIRQAQRIVGGGK